MLKSRREIESYVPDSGLRAEALAEHRLFVERVISWRADPARESWAWALDFKNGLRGDLREDLLFRDYIVPLVPLVTDELNVVTDAFVRINSQGKSMSEAHMLRALTYLETN